MKQKPTTLILRLWHRDGDVMAEVRTPDRGEPRYFGSGADLLAFLRGSGSGGAPDDEQQR